MLSRGHIIGKIVDDLASLKYQIEMRNKLGLFDLTKVCEDFLRELLNYTYGENLENLNKTRSNEPGLDLGSERNRVAYQITSQKTSQKINDTLSAITAKQHSTFDIINVFIIGERQNSYTLDGTLCVKYNFDESKNIKDINSLLRDIILLDIDKLDTIYTLFKHEFRQIRIELEPVDKDGNFESSYYNLLETKPSNPPQNGLRYFGETDEYYKKEFQNLITLYNKLSKVPRVTREVLAIIVEKGKFEPADIHNKYGIIPEALERFMKISKNELLVEINILENAGLVWIDEGNVGERTVHFVVIRETMLNELFSWLIDEGISIRTLLNTMDFTVLDKKIKSKKVKS
jgi:hypothetical protein